MSMLSDPSRAAREGRSCADEQFLKVFLTIFTLLAKTNTAMMTAINEE